MSARRFAIDAIFRAIDRITGPLRRMSIGLRRFSNTASGMANAMQAKFAGLSGAISGVAGSIIGINEAINSAMVGSNFEQVITNAAARFGAFNETGELVQQTFNDLSESAKKIGATTSFSASQAGSALDFLAKAGFSAEEAIGALPSIVNGAISAGMELEGFADIASDVMGQFDLMVKNDPEALAKNMARVTDVLAKGANMANMSVSEMFEAMKEGGPVATAAGAQIEEVAAMIAILADSGIKGSQAGTVLKNSMLNLQAGSKPVMDSLKDLNIDAFDPMTKKMKPMARLIDEIADAMSNLTPKQQALHMRTIFGMEAIAGMNVMFSEGAETLEDYTSQLQNATGFSETLSQVMGSTVGSAWRTMMSSIEGVRLDIFAEFRDEALAAINAVIDVIRTHGPEFARIFGETIAKALEWLTEQMQALKNANFQEVLDNISSRFNGIMEFGKAILFSYVALKTFAAVFAIASFIAALGPAGWLLAGVFALSGLAVTLMDAWGPVGDFFKNLLTDIIKQFASWADSIIGSVGRAIDQVTRFLGLSNESTGSANNTTIESLQKKFSVSEKTNPLPLMSGKRTNMPIDDQIANQIATLDFSTALAGGFKDQRIEKAEVVIKDETGRAEIRGGENMKNTSMQLASSGAM